MRYLFFLFISNVSFGQQRIDTAVIFSIGGLKQFVSIKGDDISKPVFLFLHGGPGSSVMNKAGKMTGKLEKEFIVVHWDQRETGRTLQLNRSPRPLKLDMFYQDTHDLIDSLLQRFGRKKLYLAGYSWGSTLGFHIADKYPEKLYANIAISPMVNTWKSELISLEMLRQKMGNRARKELAEVKIPFENADQLYYHRKWLFINDGQRLVRLTLKKSFFRSWAETWFEPWIESCAKNLFESMPLLNCPVYFFAGGKDYQTNFSVARDYYEILKAPKKDFFLFEESGHGLPETDSELFQEIILKKILPSTSQ